MDDMWFPTSRAAAFMPWDGAAAATTCGDHLYFRLGTAELFPAIAEAYYQRVPLVVLTADRPKEWVDQATGQTIVQENAFGTHVLSAVQLNTIIRISTAGC